VWVLENDRTYINQNPKCEPQLGKRGLYHTVGGSAHAPASEMAMRWALSYSDGQHSALDIAERSGLPFEAIDRTVKVLRDHGLLKEMP
jgi:aminopeptidase-like protein